MVLTNVIYLIYNSEKNGLSKVIYAEQVIYFFGNIFLKLILRKTDKRRREVLKRNVLINICYQYW